jgi:hypothetical protein
MSQIEINKISTSGSGGSKKATSKSAPKEEKKEPVSKVSTDMTAKDAIKHINDTPLDQLKGFVPEDEDRVTVQRAWEAKQEG